MLDDIKKFRKEFANQAKDHKARNAFLGVMVESSDGLQYKKLGDGPCHGALQKYQLKDKGVLLPIKYIFSSVQDYQYKEEEIKPYVDWLANRSPWAAMHIEKDAGTILKLGWVVDADFPANFVASGLIATRAFSESYTPSIANRFSTYLHILSLGFKEEEALILSYLFVKAGNNLSRYSVVFTELVAGHGIFHLGGQAESYYRNFLLSAPKNLQSYTLKAGKGYENEVNAVWKTPSVASTDAFIRWIKQVRPIDSVGKKNLNIFEKVMTDGWEYTTEEGFKSVLEQILERILNAK